MKIHVLVQEWFQIWEEGDFDRLPLHTDFKHTSPFGVIEGKKAYLDLGRTNKDKFLGHTFQILDSIIDGDSPCVRYCSDPGTEIEMDVSEWFFFDHGKIKEVVSYYHIGEIRDDRRLKMDR